MPNPISSENRSVYDPSATPGVEECDPHMACCALSSPASPEATRQVTIAPVYVTGDLDSGAQQLVGRHDALAAPSCANERSKANVTCGLAEAGAMTLALSAPTGIGLVLGAIATAGAGMHCAREIVAARDCEEQGQRRAVLDAECSARDGVLLIGATGNLICLGLK
ncbi:MAG TPA: hypothetical protein VJV79_12810 [Polyangiaceae bacterium]|nr:hypothetical protein [Polyangiaceae bacterium]